MTPSGIGPSGSSIRDDYHHPSQPSLKGYSRDPEKAIEVIYTNHRGETATRKINPWTVWWGASDYHEDEQWFLTCWDHDRTDLRTYALKDCDFRRVRNTEWRRDDS